MCLFNVIKAATILFFAIVMNKVFQQRLYG